MRVALPDTVRHHGVAIPKGTIVRTMRRQRKPPTSSALWIEYVPAPRLPEHCAGRSETVEGVLASVKTIAHRARALNSIVVGGRRWWYPVDSYVGHVIANLPSNARVTAIDTFKNTISYEVA